MEELADEVRAIIHELAENEVPADKEQEALALARQLRDLLDGPRRPRWYDRLGEGMLDPQGESAFMAHSLYRGRENPLSPPMVMSTVTREDGRRARRGVVNLAMGYEGPPHAVHGGYVAGLFDDILGSAQSLVEGMRAVTGKLTIWYRHITPIEEELIFEAWIESDEGRRVVAKATCHADGGELLTAEAEALFIRVDFEEIQARMAARRDA